MALTATQIQTKIDLYEDAIDNILLTGQRYEIGSGTSKRVFEAADIDKLQSLVDRLYMKLDEVSETSGSQVGF